MVDSNILLTMPNQPETFCWSSSAGRVSEQKMHMIGSSSSADRAVTYCQGPEWGWWQSGEWPSFLSGVREQIYSCAMHHSEQHKHNRQVRGRRPRADKIRTKTRLNIEKHFPTFFFSLLLDALACRRPTPTDVEVSDVAPKNNSPFIKPPLVSWTSDHIRSISRKIAANPNIASSCNVPV